MAERFAGNWRFRLLFVLFACLVGFVQLLPLNPGPGQVPGPDILLLIAFVWTIMRPEYIPVLLLAAVFLMSDLLLMRPPGLWTALAILGCEFLRSRRIALRNAPFFIEWMLVAAVVVSMVVAEALILGIFDVAQPTVGLTVIRMAFTIAAYPLVLVLADRAFGLSKAGGEGDAFGAGR